MFCRHTEANREINCPAAQAQYLHEHRSVREASWPAWNHYNSLGRAQGEVWHSELCNTCTAADYQSVCQAAHAGDCLDGGGRPIPGCNNAGVVQGAGPSSVGQIQCDDNLCTNKCRGLHDAFDATLVGAVAQKDGSAYGKGIANFINARGDSITWTLHACNAGAHKIGINYALANDHDGANQRPLVVTVNGVNAGPIDRRTGLHASLRFPETGGGSEWGEVYMDVQLNGGQNTIVLTPDPAVGQSGANINYMRVFPTDDYDQGMARFNFDNSGAFYVNEVLVGGGDGSWNPDGSLQLGGVTGWDITNTFTFHAPCDAPSVYAVHGMDAETGRPGLGGIIGEITHCGEVITTGARWKCTPTDGPGVTAELVSEWKSVNFDDSGWEIGSERAGWGSAGTGTIEDAVVDAIVGKMMWTSDYDGHNDVFCRIVHDHKPPNCKDAADRYAQDYPEIMQQREARTLSPFAHFNQFGRAEGRIW